MRIRLSCDIRAAQSAGLSPGAKEMPLNKVLTTSTKNKLIPIDTDIAEPTQPSAKKRINVEAWADGEKIERIQKEVATEAGLIDSDKSDTRQESQGKQLAKENSPPRVSGADLHRRLRAIRTNQDETSDGGKYCSSPTQQYLATSTARIKAGGTAPSGYFVAPSQAAKDEWRCSRFGRNVITIAHPGGATKTIPKTCNECEGCIRYRLDLKVLRYLASNPAELQTVLQFTAPNPFEGWKFRKNAQHNRRATTRRISLLHQNYLEADEDGSEMPTHGILIWDGPMAEDKCEAIKKHADDNGMYNVRVDVIPLDGDTLREMMPNGLTIIREGGNTVETCRLVRGWAKERKLERNWLDGEQKTERIPEYGEPITRVQMSERAKAIEASWKPRFEFERDIYLTPEEKQAKRAEAMPYLHRARYVGTKDWLDTESGRALKAMRRCIEAIRNGEQSPIRFWRIVSKAPLELVEETGKFLSGQREPEPAILLIAERLGFISPQEEPHIDPAFLSELTDRLPPLERSSSPRQSGRVASIGLSVTVPRGKQGTEPRRNEAARITPGVPIVPNSVEAPERRAGDTNACQFPNQPHTETQMHRRQLETLKSPKYSLSG